MEVQNAKNVSVVLHYSLKKCKILKIFIVKSIAGVAGKKIGQAAAVETAKKVAQSKAKTVLLTLGKFLKDINPFECIGDMASKQLAYGVLEEKLPALAKQSAYNVYYSVKTDLEETVLRPLDEKIDIMLESLKECRDTKYLSRQNLVNQKSQIEIDMNRIISVTEGIMRLP